MESLPRYILVSPAQEREHDSEDEDEDKYADDIDMPGQNFDSKRRITVRNLRIREDIAKVRVYFSLSSGVHLWSRLSRGQ